MKKIAYFMLIIFSQQINCGSKTIQSDITAETASISQFFIDENNEMFTIDDTVHIYYYKNKVLYEIVNTFYKEVDDSVTLIPDNQFFLETIGDTVCTSFNSKLKLIDSISQKELNNRLFFKNAVFKMDSKYYEYKSVEKAGLELIIGKRKKVIDNDNPVFIKLYFDSKFNHFKTELTKIESNKRKMKFHRFETIYPKGSKFKNVILKKEGKFIMDLKKKNRIDNSIVAFLRKQSL